MSFSFFLQKTWVPLSARPTTLGPYPSPSAAPIPYGRNVLYVEGKGQDGSPATTNYTYVSAYTTYNPASYTYTAATYSYSPASYSYTPASYTYTAGSFNSCSTGLYCYIEFYGEPGYTYFTYGACGGYYEAYGGGTLYCADTGTNVNYYNPPSYTYTGASYSYTPASYPLSSPESYTYTAASYTYTPAAYPYASYYAGAVGAAASAMGVTFPGGAIGSAAPYVGPTLVSYYSYPDNASHPVTVPSGGYITVKVY